jgi:hypothetical protein
MLLHLQWWSYRFHLWIFSIVQDVKILDAAKRGDSSTMKELLRESQREDIDKADKVDDFCKIVVALSRSTPH